MKFIIGAFSLMLFGISALASVSYRVENQTTENNFTEFTAVGKPGFIKIHGKGNVPVGEGVFEGGKLRGVFKIRLTDLDTGMSLRNRHMLGYLGAEKNPEAVLEISPLSVPVFESGAKDGDESTFNFSGTLSLNGIKKEVQGTGVAKVVGDKIHLDCQYPVNIKEFDIKTPEYAGIKVTENVNIHSSFNLVHETEDELKK